MFKIKWPWVRRADDEERLRRYAEHRREKAEEDWGSLRETTEAISNEVDLNDWTRTALIVFKGGTYKSARTE